MASDRPTDIPATWTLGATGPEIPASGHPVFALAVRRQAGPAGIVGDVRHSISREAAMVDDLPAMQTALVENRTSPQYRCPLRTT
jgi:hypothetical protein